MFLDSRTLSKEVSAQLEVLALLAGGPLSQEQGAGSKTALGKSVSGDLHKERNPLSGLIAFCQYAVGLHCPKAHPLSRAQTGVRIAWSDFAGTQQCCRAPNSRS